MARGVGAATGAGVGATVAGAAGGCGTVDGAAGAVVVAGAELGTTGAWAEPTDCVGGAVDPTAAVPGASRAGLGPVVACVVGVGVTAAAFEGAAGAAAADTTSHDPRTSAPTAATVTGVDQRRLWLLPPMHGPFDEILLTDPATPPRLCSLDMKVVPSTARGRAFAVVGVVIMLFAAATARLFVWPPTDRAARVDAVVALGGDPGQHRAHAALALATSGFAPVAVISLGGTRPVPCPRTSARHVQVICFRADPLDTRGEAEYVADLAARRHWTRLIVVSERSQATRARMLFERCTTAHLLMVPVNDPTSHLPYDVAYEWGALAKALVVRRSC